jgi:hypothetical protein
MDLLYLVMVCGCNTVSERRSNCKFFTQFCGFVIRTVFLVLLWDITVLRKVKPADWIIYVSLGLQLSLTIQLLKIKAKNAVSVVQSLNIFLG